MDDILAAIRKALEEKGISEAEASRRAVGHAEAIKSLRRRRGSGKQAHPIENLKAVADVLGLEFYIGPPRPRPADCVAPDGACVDVGDFAAIPRLGVEAAAGAGRIAEAEAPEDYLMFRREWLARQGVKPADAALITARGDSMAPRIADGDLVLVDLARRDLPRPRGREARIPPRLMVLRQGDDGLRIKWAQVAGEALVLTSENAADYPPEVLSGPELEATEILGRVAWWGHTVR